jgi:hypothetical protein
MDETISSHKRSAGRFKFISMGTGLFLSGALLAVGASGWYYGDVMDARIAAYDRQVARLVSEVDYERTTNRNILIGLTDELHVIADNLKTTSVTVHTAAKTAKAAATVVQGAANNASISRIRVTEIPPERVEPSPAPTFVSEWVEP